MKIFVRTLCGAFAVWCIFALAQPLLAEFGFDFTIEKIGNWGNSFGALNAMIGAVGFSAVAYTAWLQRKILDLQRDQIDATIRDQHRQRFASQYIEMLKLLREARQDVRFSYSDTYLASSRQAMENANVVFDGLEAFRRAWDEVRLNVSLSNTPTEIGNVYMNIVHSRYESNLGAYFRIVYTLIHMIRTDNVLDIKDKIRFSNLLRSQLTSDELILHGLNGLCPVSKDFGDMIKEFRLLKYIPDDYRRKIMQKCYPPEAFAARD